MTSPREFRRITTAKEKAGAAASNPRTDRPFPFVVPPSAIKNRETVRGAGTMSAITTTGGGGTPVYSSSNYQKPKKQAYSGTATGDNTTSGLTTGTASADVTLVPGNTYLLDLNAVIEFSATYDLQFRLSGYFGEGVFTVTYGVAQSTGATAYSGTTTSLFRYIVAADLPGTQFPTVQITQGGTTFYLATIRIVGSFIPYDTTLGLEYTTQSDAPSTVASPISVRTCSILVEDVTPPAIVPDLIEEIPV